MKRWLVAVAVVLVLVVGAAAAAVLSFDPDSQKQRVIDAVYRATGRKLTLAGPVRIEWHLMPVLAASDAALANMAGGSQPQMVTVGRVTATVSLLPLLSRRVEITQVTLEHPAILLETDAAGRGNWRFTRPPAAPAGPSSPGGAKTPIVLDNVAVQDATLTWHDGVTGRTITAAVPDASLRLGDLRAHLVARARVQRADATVDATLGTWAQMVAPEGSWPIQATASLGAATATFDGIADPASRNLTGRLQASIPDLPQTGALLDIRPWPALHDVHLAATITGPARLPEDVSLQIGASDLGAILPGLTVGALDLTWPAGQPARLQANGAMPGGPWTAVSGIIPAGNGVALRGMQVTAPAGDIAGDLALSRGPVPAVRGTIVSSRLDLDAVRALAMPAAQPAPAPPAAAVPAPAAAPAPALPWRVLQRDDADLQVSIGTLRLAGADYQAVTGHVVLQDGALAIGPATIRTPQGPAAFSFSVDSRQPGPPVALTFHSDAVALNPLLQALGLPGGSSGAAELDVALHAAGNTLPELAATVDGHAALAVVDADIANAVLIAVLGDLLPSTGLKIGPNGTSHVRCLALAAAAATGQVTLSTMTLDTPRLALTGTGGVDLVHDMLSLHLRPVVRLGGAAVAAPVRVDGALRKPVVALDPAGPDGRAGVTFGATIAAPDTCAADLTAARAGRAGPLPAEAAAKPPKPADLLRSLLK